MKTEKNAINLDCSIPFNMSLFFLNHELLMYYEIIVNKKTMAPKKKAIWLNYDFGLRGNYNALFTFLDNYNAKDCGNGLAYLEYDNPNELSSDMLIKKLEEEIAKTVEPAHNDRIYVIWRDDQSSDNKVKGRFLFGKRKLAPWNGYSNKNESKTSDEAI